MPELIEKPAIIESAGNKPKLIEEYISVCTPAFSPQLVHRDD